MAPASSRPTPICDTFCPLLAADSNSAWRHASTRRQPSGNWPPYCFSHSAQAAAICGVLAEVPPPSMS